MHYRGRPFAPTNRGQIVVAWVVLLLALTLLGALPLLVEGLNLSKVSSSTPHLAVVMTGMLVVSCSPTLAALLIAGLYPGSGRNLFHYPSGKRLAGSLHLVRDCPGRANCSSPCSRGVQRGRARHGAFPLDDFASILRTRWFVLCRLWVAFCRRAGLARLCAAATADALRRPRSQHPCRTPLEHMAPVVRDHSRSQCDWNRRASDLRTAYLNRNHLCVDVQQHKRKLIDSDACASRTQPCSQSYTDTG